MTPTRDSLLTNRDSDMSSSEEGGNSQCYSGALLPNPRLVSRTFHTDADVTIDRDQVRNGDMKAVVGVALVAQGN